MISYGVFRSVVCNAALGFCAVVPMLGVRAHLAGTVDAFQLSVLSTIRLIPWFLKPMVGFICDSFLGERSTFSLGFVGVAVSWYYLPSDFDNVNAIALISFFASASLAFADVGLDSYAIKAHSGSRDSASKIMSNVWITRTASAAFATVLAGVFSVKTCAVLSSLVAMFMPSVSVDRVEKSKNPSVGMPKRRVFFFAVICFIVSCGPSADPVMTTVLGKQYGWKKQSFASMGLIETATMVLTTLFYRLRSRLFNPVRVIVWCTIGITLSVLLQLILTCVDVGYQLSFVVIAISYVLTIGFNSTFGSVILTESSRNLPKGSEAGVYTLIAASFNLGSSVSALSGGVISSHFSPSVVVVIDSVSTVLLFLTVVLISKEETGTDSDGGGVVEQHVGDDL